MAEDLYAVLCRFYYFSANASASVIGGGSRSGWLGLQIIRAVIVHDGSSFELFTVIELF